MDEQTARKILKGAVREHDNLESHAVPYNSPERFGGYLHWNSCCDDAELDGNYTAEQLLAIAWWIENKRKKDF